MDFFSFFSYVAIVSNKCVLFDLLLLDKPLFYMMEAKQDLVAKPFWWQESKTNQFLLSENFSGGTIITSILSETTVFS